MFGSQPGEERRQGVMNQSVVTKIDAGKIVYYVMHTRGENSLSVFIAELGKEFKRSTKALTYSEVNQLVEDQVRTVRETRAYLTLQEFERVQDTMVIPWCKTKEETLESVLNAAHSSCILGVVKIDHE